MECVAARHPVCVVVALREQYQYFEPPPRVSGVARKESAMASSNEPFRHLPGVISEIHENRNQDIRAGIRTLVFPNTSPAKEALATLVEYLPEGTVASTRYLSIRASKTSAVIPSVLNRTPTIRWRRPRKILAHHNLSSDLRAAAFGFYNNIVTTQQRKYSIHLTADPACPLCGNIDT
ncbi:hypothetical protein PR048_026800 [Dryococelus australis]|uniref:Uncharacterized protein n=1 Tax=Dryococelus australis TaxID=614101 RepID=A0ABQ9GMD4_9NEOP|nr:hypothetical protein PR048_026800 [Dryococelus australis]